MSVIIAGIPVLFAGVICRTVVIRKMAKAFGPETALDRMVAKRYRSEFPADTLTSQLRLANWLCGLGAILFLGVWIAALIMFRNIH